MDWVVPECLLDSDWGVWQGSFQWRPLSTLPAPCLEARQHLNTPHELNLGFSSLCICPSCSSSRHGMACLLCVGPQDWGTQSVTQLSHSPGKMSTCAVPFPLSPFLGAQFPTRYFSSYPAQLLMYLWRHTLVAHCLCVYVYYKHVHILKVVDWVLQKLGWFLLNGPQESLPLERSGNNYIGLLKFEFLLYQFILVQLLSRVWLFAAPWITARQASLSITNSWSPLKLTSIESVMPFSHLTLCCPLLLLLPIPPSIGVLSNESTLRMRWPKYWSFSFSIFLPKNTQDWSPSEWTGWIFLQSKGLSGVFSNTTVQKHQFFGAQLSTQSNSHIHTWPQEKP